MAISPEKIATFEYTVVQLKKWYCGLNNITTDQDFNLANDFSKLKVIKLHFFVCAINSNKNSLLQLFDFYAMPYGHVESDVLDAINCNLFERFEFNNEKITIKSDFLETLDISFERLEYFDQVDSAIASLQKENNNLVNSSALELVDLSHRWVSWRMVFNNARSRNRYSERIPTEIIQRELKSFTIVH